MACVVTVYGAPKVAMAQAVIGSEIAQTAIRLIEAPLHAGGTSPEGFDCSGLAWYAHHLLGIEVPRTAEDQSRAARRVALKALMPGDLLFFHVKGKEKGKSHDHAVDHVGIYIGQGLFVHVSSVERAVAYGSLDNAYFRSHLVSAGRFWSLPLRASR